MASVTRIGDGVYRVDDDGAQTFVYVAGTAGDRVGVLATARYIASALSDQTVRQSGHAEAAAEATSAGRRTLRVTAPMPATVVKILVAAGTSGQDRATRSSCSKR